MKILKQHWLLILLLTLSLAIRYLYIKIGLENFTVNGDEAANFLQAQEIASGARPLLFWGQPYQFPLEGYLMAFFRQFLAWDTFGVRIVPILICFVSFLIFFLLFIKMDKFKETWPGLLLLLFPSTYCLLRQTILLTPQHSIAFLSAALCPLAVWYSKNSKYKKTFCFIGGVASGLTLSNHLLAVSIVVMTIIAICFGRSFLSALKNTFTFSFGFLLGFLPYLYAKLFIEGACQEVSNTNSLLHSVKKIWNPIFTEFIPTSLGINTIFYPDVGDKVSTFNFFTLPFSLLFAALLVFLIFDRFLKFIKRIKNNKWPSLETIDVLLGTSIIAIILLSMTKMDLRPRYALFIVWCFPFLLYYVYKISSGLPRKFIAALSVFLLVVNIVNAKEVYSFWNMEKVSEKHAFMPNLNPLYKYFRDNNVSHCYAGWWLAYQINLNSKNEFICSPPFNDRFMAWEQPYYRKLVDEELNTPFVVGVYQHRWLETENILTNFAAERLRLKKKRVGKFTVLDNLKHKDVSNSKIVDVKNVHVLNASLGKNNKNLIDGNLETFWRTKTIQTKNHFLELEVDSPISLHGIKLFLNVKDCTKECPHVKITSTDSKGKEVMLKENNTGILYPVKLDKNYQREFYKGTELFFGFRPAEVKKIKIKIVEPKEDYRWSISEIQLYAEGGINSDSNSMPEINY